MQALTPPERRTVSVEDAAVMLGVGRTTAYAAVRRGELASVRIGRRVVVPVAAIERLLSAAGAPQTLNPDRRAGAA